MTWKGKRVSSFVFQSVSSSLVLQIVVFAIHTIYESRECPALMEAEDDEEDSDELPDAGQVCFGCAWQSSC